jgi:hypothetical protein
MAGETDLSSIQGWAKERHAKAQHLEIPKLAKVTKRIKFNSEKKLGKALVWPVFTTSEGGFTHGSGATLNNFKSAQSEDAELEGKQITLGSRIDLKVLTSLQNDKDSFGRWYDEHYLNCRRSMARRLESVNIYGGLPMATFTGAGTLSGAAGTRTITIPKKDTAPAIFMGTRTHEIDLYNGATKINQDDVVSITSWNPVTRQLVIAGDADDLTDLDTAWAAGAGTIDIHWKGMYGETASGLVKIGAETGSVLYANINHATYPDIWQGSALNVGGINADWEKVWNVLEMMAGKGSECGLVGQTSLAQWSAWMADLTALRVFDASYEVKEAKLGHKKILITGPNGNPVTFEPSPFIKGGDTIIFPDTADDEFSECAERIGSTDMTAMHPLSKGEMIVQVPGTNFFESKWYSDQAMKCSPRDIGYLYNATQP